MVLRAIMHELVQVEPIGMSNGVGTQPPAHPAYIVPVPVVIEPGKVILFFARIPVILYYDIEPLVTRHVSRVAERKELFIADDARGCIQLEAGGVQVLTQLI